MKADMPSFPPEDTTTAQPPLLRWFVEQIESFAPPAAREQRCQLYADMCVMNARSDTPPEEHIALFVLAQIVAAQQLAASPVRRKPARGQNAHETWYAKERRRIAKLLQQIQESPVVASLQATVRYYPAEDVTCPHGHNLKTCEALYGLRFTLHLLESYPAQPGVRKQIERLRRREPYLPPLHELCLPQGPPLESVAEDDAVGPLPPAAVEPQAVYLLGTVVGRLRQDGLSVADSCAYVDRILTCCFDQPDPDGTRRALLAEQWRRLC